MTRFCGTRFSDLQAHLKPILINNRLETVTTQRGITVEFFTVHMPEFHTAYTRIHLPNRMNKLYSKCFLGEFGKSCLFNVFEICLLGNAKQSTQCGYGISPLVLRMQVCYCLAPTFFLILMLNCSSVTFIISSYASARRR